MKRKHHEHKGESIIGKIIYAFLLFIPLFAIGSTILVNTFNSEAKTEAKIVYKYETNEVNSAEDLIDGNIYHLSIPLSVINNDDTIENKSYYLICKNIYNINSITTSTSIESFEYQNIYLIKDTIYNNLLTIRKNLNNNTNLVYELNNNTINADIVLDSNSIYLFSYEYFSKCNQDNIPIESVNSKEVSNVFYNSIDKVKQSDLFNWTENNVIYTGISNTAELLSITDTFIPMLLTYWLIISVFYFLYDIVLMCVLVIHKKIHELQDSI